MRTINASEIAVGMVIKYKNVTVTVRRVYWAIDGLIDVKGVDGESLALSPSEAVIVIKEAA